jgi:predicted RNA polymerase sigma factor
VNLDALEEVEDDRLRLIFTCCHPAIEMESRVALTLTANVAEKRFLERRLREVTP